VRTNGIFSVAAIAAILIPGLIAMGQDKSKSTSIKQTAKKIMYETTSSGNPIVVMKTSLGTVKIELFQDKAPVSTKNFLEYVDEKYYDNTVFHRVIKRFMIQGGGFAATDPIKQKKTHDPIVNESKNGVTNERGTLAMARTSDPNSATSQFFINTVNNNSLNPGQGDPNGYAVFGKVVDGMDVVDRIEAVPTANAPAVALAGGKELPTTFQNVPVTKVVVISVRRAELAK
jgi:peptidyl-prolyl cis-trans isomerase A (cyclophilin A)